VRKQERASFLKKRSKKLFINVGVGTGMGNAIWPGEQKFFCFFFFKKRSAFLLPFLLASCGGPPPPPIVYKPIDFSYLPPMTLRVANVNVQNTYVPDPDDATLIGEDPEAPANALMDLLNRRLVASGAPGTATATIEVASLDESGGNLTGTMTVRVDVASADGKQTGFTEASVTSTEAAPDSDASQEDVRAALFGMTKSLVEDLNDRLQYQVQHDLANWLVVGGVSGAGVSPGGAVTGGIVATPLTPSTPAPPPPPAAGAPNNTLPPGSLPLGTLPLGTLPVGPAPGTGVSQ
jgi:hypothetical protein